MSFSSMFLVVAGLVLFETITSIDNAIVGHFFLRSVRAQRASL